MRTRLAPSRGERPTRAVLAALVVMLLAPLVHGAEPALRVVPATGPHVRAGRWIRVYVDRPASEDVDGTAELRLLRPGGEEAMICRIATGPVRAGEAARFRFWILPDDASADLAFRIRTAEGEVRDAVTFRDALHPAPPGRRSILVTTRLPAVIERSSVASVRPGDLPREAQAYANIDLLVVAHEEDPIPADAISEWVALGGALILLTPGHGEALASAVRERGWQLGEPVPFLLPGERQTAADHSQAVPLRRLGRGVVIDLGAHPRFGSALLARRAIWTRIERELLPPPPLRDALRVRALPGDWPPPPRAETQTVGAAVGLWALVLLAILALPPVRKRPAAMTLAMLGVSLLGGMILLRRIPHRDAHTLRACLRVVGEAGQGGPTLDETLLLATPFETGRPAAIPLNSETPPRPLTRSRSGSGNLRVEWDESLAPPRLRVMPDAKKQTPRRGRPLLLATRAAGPALETPPVLCQRTADGTLLLGSSATAPALHDARLITAEGEVRLGRYDWGDRIAPAPTRPSASASARDRVWAMLRQEHRPGAYAILVGWTTEAAHGDDLGEMRVHTLNLIPGSP